MSSINFSHVLFVLVFAGVWYMTNVLKQWLLQEIKTRDVVLNESLASRVAQMKTEYATELNTRDKKLYCVH